MYCVSIASSKMVFHAIIPARFLSLTAHLVLTIMLFWSREPNVLSCIPQTAGADSPEYSRKDAQLLVALSLTLAFIVLELIGFFSGLSMFTALPNMFSITTHVSACIVLALFAVNEWSCDDYWYVFGFCSIPAIFLEVIVVLWTLKCKVFT